MTRAFLCMAAARLEVALIRIRSCVFRIAALQQSPFNVRRECVFWFSSKRCTSSRRASISDGPLLLPRDVCRNGDTPPPSRCSVFSESLPHLLPRQAFSFSGPWYQSPSASCGSCPISSVLSDDRVIPNSRTDRLNGNTEASRVSAFSKTMSTSDTGPETVLLRVA